MAESAASFSANVVHAAGRYFETIGTALLRGRDFRRELEMAAPAVTGNRTKAKRLFGDQDPVGRQVKTGNDRMFQIIGLAGDSKSATFGEEVRPCAYA